MTKQLKIGRFNGVDEVPRQDWKSLISALVMVGYEVYADNNHICIKLGGDDEVQEIEK